MPHPTVYAVCDDPAIIGACFYLMQPLEGFAPSGQLPNRYGTDASWRRTMGEEMVRAAAALAAVDPAAVGLQGLGKPDDWHERQVGRWRSQLDGYRSMPSYDSVGLPHVEEVGRWLTDHLPRDRRIGLIHGDLQFANVLFSLHAPRISGVVDWELATLGDPLLDLGWVLGSWWEEGDPDGKRPLVAPWENFMSRAELARRYGEITGRGIERAALVLHVGLLQARLSTRGDLRALAGRPGAGAHRRADSRLCDLADAQGDAAHLELTRTAPLRPAFDTDDGCGRPPSAGN